LKKMLSVLRARETEPMTVSCAVWFKMPASFRGNARLYTSGTLT